MRACSPGLIVLLAGLVVSPVLAGQEPEPLVIGFEPGDAPGLALPEAAAAHWRLDAVEGASPQGEGHVILLGADAVAPPGAATRVTDAAPYAGEVIRLSAWLKVTGEPGPLAGLWLRVDGDTPGRPLFFDNMSDRPVQAGDWARYEIMAYVPEGATRLLYGVLKSAPGTLAVDEMMLVIADADARAMSEEARVYLDEALALLERHHINSGRADWPEIRTVATGMAAGAETPADVHPALVAVVGLMGERHSRFISAPETRDPSSVWSGSRNRPPEVGMAAPGVGLLTLPPLTAGGTQDPDGQIYSSTLSRALTDQAANGACGWIVDLRGNGGGNMWPMLNGLEALLGAGPFGGFGSADGPRAQWVRDGSIIASRPVGTDIQPGTSGRLAGAPVAVLTGPQTGSSGEMVAIAFRGRDRTRSFGAPTAGLTTANTPFPLSDGSRLLITTSGVLDAAGRFIQGPLVPDEAVPADTVLDRALQWLGESGCGAGPQ